MSNILNNDNSNNRNNGKNDSNALWIKIIINKKKLLKKVTSK